MARNGSAVRRVIISELEVASGGSAVHDDIENALFTRMNEQVGFLTRGSRLLDFMDEAADDSTAEAALDEAIAVVQAYVPKVRLTQAQVTLDGSSVEVALEYEYDGRVYRDAVAYAK